MNRRLFVFSFALLAAMTGFLTADDDDDDDENFVGPLETTITVEGDGKLTARYRIDNDDRRSLLVQMEGLESRAGQTVVINIVSDGNSDAYESVRISTDGTAKIDKRGRRGHFVPALGPGDRIVVKDSSDNEVLAGSF